MDNPQSFPRADSGQTGGQMGGAQKFGTPPPNLPGASQSSVPRFESTQMNSQSQPPKPMSPQTGSSASFPPAKFTAPPQQGVNVRTMASDTRSIGRGDPSPMPDTIIPPQDDSEPMFKPGTQVSEGFGDNSGSGKSKKVIGWVVGIVVVIALVAVGYFFVYPMLFPETPEPEPVPPVTVEEPQIAPHQSLFTSAPDAVTEVRLFNVLHSTIKSAFALFQSAPLASDSVQEVVVFDNDGSQVPLPAFLNAFVPTLTTEQIAMWFEDDFTAFVYYDASGVWPGYIARLKNGVNIDEAKAALAVLESADLNRFYLGTPMEFGTFKDGQINAKATRYNVGSLSGASFNYGILNNYLVISTSYTGLQAVAPMLGIQ